MQLFGRELTARQVVGRALEFPLLVARLGAIVEDPIGVLRGYLTKKSPPSVRLRSGHTIHLGSHPDDILTFVVVFGRQDYGRIGKGWTVIDVGANIGLFALYAALNGARKVYAIEPTAQAFEVLRKNIDANGFAGVIEPLNLAVADAERTIRMPVRSSPYNSIYAGHGVPDNEMQDARALPLRAILDAQGIEHIDLLKMDCEGAEYEIVPSLEQETLARIDRFRMECHGSQDELIALFRSSQMTVAKSQPPLLWLAGRRGV